MNVSFHLITGDEERQATALNIVRNTLDDETLDLDDVVVVAQSGGTDPVTAQGTGSDRVRELLDRGVSFRACSNTLDSEGLRADDLVDDVETVSSGSGELARLQEAEYAYIRP